MTVHTMIVSIVIPNGSNPKPAATVVWPSGEIQQIVLQDHNWLYDWDRNYGDHSGGRAPASFYRWLNDQTLVSGALVIHGDRKVYKSPEYVGTEINEAGRLTVWEIDYEVSA